jgi:hypothetical protein
LNEANNTTILQNISLRISPKTNPVPNHGILQSRFRNWNFRFSKYEEVVKVNPEDSVSFIPHWKGTLGVENGQ